MANNDEIKVERCTALINKENIITVTLEVDKEIYDKFKDRLNSGQVNVDFILI
jgi:hypothetical protein